MRSSYARFYALLARMPFGDKEELKKNLIKQYAKRRTTSLRALTDEEYNTVCDAMQKIVAADGTNQFQRNELRKHRSTVLALLQRGGLDTTDWHKIDRYCLNTRIAGREFRKLSVEDLKCLAVKLRLIERKRKNKINSKLN